MRGDHFSWKEKDTMRSPIRRTRKKQREIVPVKSLVVSRMQGIEPVMTGKSDRKFRFVAHEAKHGPMGREYVWKCATVEERNRWVATLRKVHLRNNCSWVIEEYGRLWNCTVIHSYLNQMIVLGNSDVTTVFCLHSIYWLEVLRTKNNLMTCSWQLANSQPRSLHVSFD